MKIIHQLLFGVVLVTTFSYLYFLSNSKQETNWQFYIEHQVGAKSVLNVGRNLTFDDEFIYFSDGKNTIYSLNQRNGRVNWTSKLYDHSPFQVTQDNASLYVASFDSHIYKLDKKNGYIIWSFAIPNQYWSDTEVVFDENDQYVFFADRGGLLYALDKNTGHEVWKKEFKTIDNTKVFQEGSIHFGFLGQKKDELVVDHFPSETIFMVDKNTGSTISQEKSFLNVDLQQPQQPLFFDRYDLKIDQNVISQPIFNLLDKKQKLIWSYQTRRKINLKEVYQHKNRMYYLDADNKIISSININPIAPEGEKFHKINFKVKENFSIHEPYKDNSNPQVDYEIKNINLWLIIREKANYYKYLLSNLTQLIQFNIDVEEKFSYLEFNISHQDNFYKNKFTQVKISGELENRSTKEKVKANGFYYDKNIWKLRAKLDPGEWQYAIKIYTPFWSKKFTGIVQVNQSKESSLLITGNGITLGENIFNPFGLQDTIFDSSRDGNSLNKIGHASQDVPPEDLDQYRYLPLADYLDLYKNEAAMNIFRYGPDNWAPSIWENLTSPKKFTMSINGNYQGDSINEEARKRGYRVMMSVFSFYPPYSSKESFAKQKNREVLEQYLDYVIARYAASVDIWELTNEALPTLKWQNFISDYLSEHDPYKHPITTSLEEPDLSNSNLLSIHYYSEIPENNRDLVNKVSNLYSRYDEWKKAKIISEFGFKGANYFTNSAGWLRKFAWIFTFKKTGIISWNTSCCLFKNPGGNGNTYLGPQERGYLKVLSEFLPLMQIDTINKFYLGNQGQLAVYELKDKGYHLFYLLNFTSVDQLQKLVIEVNKKGLVIFVDPKTGSVLQKLSVSKGQQELILPVFKDDLAIKISYD
ncbi:MAG: PQQ-binding-like beta-propeller repeat protein [Candidatus Pacebacteria bacterium]|nr:PQQ-binding-like beta-propeller repeat protein [Candidatus Paceibacterota bacterium]